jgi:hypothetical protein
MKYSNYIGIVGSLTMVISCFFPMAYYPDLDKSFTGFFSEANIYGKPGFFFIFFGAAAILLFVVPKIWAKRINLLVGALIVAFAVKTSILFMTCYRGTCPVMRGGLYLLLVSSGVVLIAAVLPDLKLKK